MLKEDIQRLRNEGKSYSEIAVELGCSKATISYHSNPEVKLHFQQARSRNRKKFTDDLKIQFGGKCTRCSYAKCLEALHFHHRDPKSKTSIRKPNGDKAGVIYLARCKNQRLAIKEAKKCDLICANCHAEIHAQ